MTFLFGENRHFRVGVDTIRMFFCLLVSCPNCNPTFPTVWQEYIERLSEYMASTGRTYKSHAATIRRWIADDRRKAAPAARDRDYSVKEGDTV